MKKRILALIMSMLLIACAVLSLASCKDDDDGDVVGPNIDWIDHLGDHDLGGAEIKFAVSEANENDGFNERSISASADTGDRVDTAIYNRNKNIEARFNCKITLAFIKNDNLADTTVKNVLSSKGSEYDIIAARQYDDVILCSEGLLLDLFANESTKQYLSVTDPWWGTKYIQGMTFNKKAFWLVGDLNLRYTGGFYATFVNAKIYDNNFKNNENYGDIHQIVKDGKWTVDMMKDLSDLATTVSSDDPAAGKIPSGEVIGVAFPIHDNTNGLAVSCGVKFSQTNKDGSITFTFHSGQTALTSFYKEYKALLDTKGCVNYYGASDNGGYSAAFADFAADKALFVPGRINQAELYLRKMDSGFYIIPNPKLDENQKNYISSLHDAISIYGINPNSKNIEASAIVLEAMAAESYRSVRPEYYDYALKNKYTTDPGTKEMIELISSSSYSDFALVWAFTSYFKATQNGDLGNFLRAELRAGVADITTHLQAEYKSGWETAIQEIDKAFAKVN
ncbi:MAG: hypothetical protein E7626_05835 [Ruminococcaceae bacterium]|nr:hypothetical protein [Oscillospiraceae bacterium]